MRFSDEYECEMNNNVYYVTVSGHKRIIEGKEIVDLDFIEIFDELGELIECDHEHYDDIYEDAVGRDYDLEVHNADFDYYDNAS